MFGRIRGPYTVKYPRQTVDSPYSSVYSWMSVVRLAEGEPSRRGSIFIHDSDVGNCMSGLEADLDAIAAAGDYDDADAVIEEAVRELLRRRPELRVSLAVEKYRTGAVSCNRAAELAGLSAEAFRDELADRGIDRDAGFLRDADRESQLETFSE